ncbi:MAG: radical SAM protein [Saezia sp.]
MGPSRLTVQWHITDRCNLRCQHCYQSEFSDRGFGIDVLERVAGEVFRFREVWEQKGGAAIPLLFNLTGGEPCAHPDFEALLCFLAKHPSKPRVGILSNGSLIDAGWARCFAELGVGFVQLSVEGARATHDGIRGLGHFEEVVRASRCLRMAGVRVVWSFTAHRGNYGEFPEVAKLARQHGVARVWSDRMIPAGKEDGPMVLSADETLDYLCLMGQAHRDAGRGWGRKTEVALVRALQFQAGGGVPYRCVAGGELLTVMPNGDVFPCRRLPICVGNVLKTSLLALYEDDVLRRLRDFEAPDACQRCLYKNVCRGGLRCLAYAVNGDMFSRDPGCTALER